ncbi:MAG TPA: flagellar basal-body MS-ring/collar protein FliF [Candidatus Baltobacteraceae bacterium]|nr:flagellar basal-body MS-ring/collar protein FliF [Candidatus Baltobacteraceae bacterium]
MLVIGAGGLAAFALIALVLFFAFDRPSYQPLFANLTSTDAAAVTQHLKDDKVPYQLSADGKTVYVPSSSLADERVAIAGANVLKGSSTGYELFDRPNFGMTEFEQNLDKGRAIEGELERTISALDPVESARVHIAEPDKTLYASTSTPATASVAIATKPGMQLSADQVQGITMLVSRAVEGLKPSDVTIVNQDGQVLVPPRGVADPNAPDPANLTADQLSAKQRYEASVQTSIQTMLDQTLGPRHAVARVSTRMNFDEGTTETKTYAPSGTVLSQQTKRESLNGSSPRAAIGVPGTSSNIGSYQGQQQQNGAYKDTKSDTTTNYDVSETNAKHIDAPGKVLSTSVAVVLNAAADPNAKGNPYQITPAMRQQVQNLVVAAAGLNLTGGDQVSVESIPFNPTVVAPPAGTVVAGPAGGAIGGIPLWLFLAVLGGGAVVGAGLLLSRVRRRSFRPAMELPSFDSTLAEELPPFEEHPMLDGAPGIAAPIRSAADLTREQMIEYVTTVAQENPDSIAKLVKLWLAE